MRFLVDHQATERVDVPVTRLLISGFTARDRAVVLAHLAGVRHLQAQLTVRLPGCPAPSSVEALN